MKDGQKVQLSLPCGSTLTAQYLGGGGIDIFNGTTGLLRALLDVSKSEDTMASVRFEGYAFDLVVPTKYLKVLS